MIALRDNKKVFFFQAFYNRTSALSGYPDYSYNIKDYRNIYGIDCLNTIDLENKQSGSKR
jgi:hypothetical protein